MRKDLPRLRSPDGQLASGLQSALDQLGHRQRVLVLPPDFTRYDSQAGKLTCMCHAYFGARLVDVMPALGTHEPMDDKQLETMFPGLPKSLIRVHRWRDDIVSLGEVSSEFVKQVTGGRVEQPWPLQINKLVVHGGHDLILSVGQVVPHEVMGMANHNKNVFIGTGGARCINDSHFISACCGVENVLGRADAPIRQILNEAERQFCSSLPLVYVLTVIGTTPDGGTVVRGLFIGDDQECFRQASLLAAEVNFTVLDKPADRMVAYLDPDEFHTTWLGNKSIYRTRMAIADDGELIVLAPGVRAFGEDPENDRLIRKFGYRTTPEVLQLVREHDELQANLGVPAHLMHSSPEDRFRVTYCAGGLSQEEVEAVGFQYGQITSYLDRYRPLQRNEGWHTDSDGEPYYFIRKPALGLWSSHSVVAT